MRLQQVAERAAEHGCKPMGKAENTNDKQNSGIGGSISMEADPLPRPAEKKWGAVEWTTGSTRIHTGHRTCDALDGWRPGHERLDVAELGRVHFS